MKAVSEVLKTAFFFAIITTNIKTPSLPAGVSDVCSRTNSVHLTLPFVAPKGS